MRRGGTGDGTTTTSVLVPHATIAIAREAVATTAVTTALTIPATMTVIAETRIPAVTEDERTTPKKSLPTHPHCLPIPHCLLARHPITHAGTLRRCRFSEFRVGEVLTAATLHLSVRAGYRPRPSQGGWGCRRRPRAAHCSFKVFLRCNLGLSRVYRDFPVLLVSLILQQPRQHNSGH